MRHTGYYWITMCDHCHDQLILLLTLWAGVCPLCTDEIWAMWQDDGGES